MHEDNEEFDVLGELPPSFRKEPSVRPGSHLVNADIIAKRRLKPAMVDPMEELAEAESSTNLKRCPQTFNTQNVELNKIHKVAAANKKRGYIGIQNGSSFLMRVGLSTPAGVGSGWKVTAGGFFEPEVAPTTDVYIFFDAPGNTGQGEYTYVEGVG